MALKYPLANGNWSNAANWNGGTIPVPGDDVRSNGFTVNVDVNIDVLILGNSASAPAVAGGGFDFNTAGVTATIGFVSIGAANLIRAVATTGVVTVNIANNFNINLSSVFSHTGGCDFTLTCPRITLTTGTAGFTTFPKSSTGLFTFNGDFFNTAVVPAGSSVILLDNTGGSTTINGNVYAGGAGSSATNLTLRNTSGGTLTINGNIFGTQLASSNASCSAITQSAGTLVVNGNINGPTVSAAGSPAITFNGSSASITGNIIGGTNVALSNAGSPTITVIGNIYGNASTGISTSAATINLTGNVYGGSGGNGIFASGVSTISVNGNVYGGTGALAINSQSSGSVSITGDAYPWAVNAASGDVTLTGNMYNSLGRNAIKSSLLYISNSTTTKWVMDLGGGATKTLYSADTFPNVPAITDVRNGITYGPALSLTGTMVVPAASDVRMDVPVDATVGTGELTSADIISGINASADPLAVRLRTILSDKTAGNLISQYNNS